MAGQPALEPVRARRHAKLERIAQQGPGVPQDRRRKLVPYYDRAEIEDGAIAGRGLEICWLKDPTDLLFAQIQGSARVKLEDGSTVRINYDAITVSHAGRPHPDRPRHRPERTDVDAEDQEWMEATLTAPGAAAAEPLLHLLPRGAAVRQGRGGRRPGCAVTSAARSRSTSRCVYGTPFFIEGELPIDLEASKTPFRRLMIAQDTGSAIVGPARADLYFGAGAEAGKVSGRLRHTMRFVMLVPKSLDPQARGRKMPLPDERPSEKIAKLFPQVDPRKDQKTATKPAEVSAATTAKDAANSADSAKAAAPAKGGKK
jgi:membrane-bound lytic murein transglycosylase A